MSHCLPSKALCLFPHSNLPRRLTHRNPLNTSQTLLHSHVPDPPALTCQSLLHSHGSPSDGLQVRQRKQILKSRSSGRHWNSLAWSPSRACVSSMQKGDCVPLTACVSLSASHCVPLTACVSLSASHCVPLTVCVSLSASHCVPLTVCVSLSASHCVPLTVCASLSAFLALCPSPSASHTLCVAQLLPLTLCSLLLVISVRSRLAAITACSCWHSLLHPRCQSLAIVGTRCLFTSAASLQVAKRGRTVDRSPRRRQERGGPSTSLPIRNRIAPATPMRS